MEGINKCPFCGKPGKELSQYRCGQRVKKCTGCGKNLMYYEVYLPYDESEVNSKPDYYSLIKKNGKKL